MFKHLTVYNGQRYEDNVSHTLYCWDIHIRSTLYAKTFDPTIDRRAEYSSRPKRSCCHRRNNALAWKTRPNGFRHSDYPWSQWLDHRVFHICSTSSLINATLPSIEGQQVQQAANEGVVIADTTLLPGHPGMMISGASVSLGSAGLIVGSSIYALSRPTPAAEYTIGGETTTAGPSSAFLLAGQAIPLGGPAVAIFGTVVPLGSAGLVVGSKTYSIPPASHRAPPLITFGGQVYTANPFGDFVVGSQTLIPGGAGITISGTPVSLAPSDEDIVVGEQTSSINLGGLIMGGFGDGSMTNSPSSLASSSVVAFTGQAVRGSDV